MLVLAGAFASLTFGLIWAPKLLNWVTLPLIHSGWKPSPFMQYLHVNVGLIFYWGYLKKHFFYSPQNLNARKAELLVGLSNLKSAASSVAKKFDEIKGAIGAGVAVTPGKLSGSGLLVCTFIYFFTLFWMI
jgi:hypothetical protein